MLDRSQWLAIGLVSGFAYILGKDRESFEAESFQAHEYSYYHRNKALKAWRKNYEASGILDDRAKWNELYDSFDKYKSQGFSKGQSMVKSMKEMGIYNQLMQGVNIDAFLDQYSAESFEAEYIHIYDTTITEPEILKKLEGAGIKPTDYYWLTEDIFGLHINSSDADAFQEEFNKKDWTGLYAFDAHGGVRFKRAESDGITRDEKGMRHSPHKKCPDCGAKPTSSWIDPGKCECGRVMNPSEYTNIRFSAFGADEDNFTEIENLLDSNDDIFLGTGDGFKPDHPNREEIIAYLTQGGGGQTPYRVCFTCSRVTPDWVTIDEGYECFPCADQ